MTDPASLAPSGPPSASGLSGQNPSGAQPLLDARQLFGDRREIVIVHNGAHYRLRITANGKLILTK
jgi:hemin uptake protein HemP